MPTVALVVELAIDSAVAPAIEPASESAIEPAIEPASWLVHAVGASFLAPNRGCIRVVLSSKGEEMGVVAFEPLSGQRR